MVTDLGGDVLTLHLAVHYSGVNHASYSDRVAEGQDGGESVTGILELKKKVLRFGRNLYRR